MKRKKNFLGMLRCCVMFFCLLMTALADGEPTLYDLWVNGERFTSEKLETTCGKDTATCDPGTNTLTPENAVITQ